MADAIYNSLFTDLANNNVDFGADTFKVLFTTSSYTQDVDAHDRRDDITNEVTGSGYSAGGVAATLSVSQDNTNDLAMVDMADITVTATITARKAVLYKSRGGASSNDELVKVFDFVTDRIAPFILVVHANGILRIKND